MWEEFDANEDEETPVWNTDEEFLDHFLDQRGAFDDPFSDPYEGADY